MRYTKKIVRLPADMQVGSEVGVIGDGDEIYTITDIVRQDGEVVDVCLSHGFREPLCKIYLLRGRDHSEAIQDQTSFPDVAIGECDVCGKKFPDSCAYHTTDKEGSMVCQDCHK
jgi:hypothetical protein